MAHIKRRSNGRWQARYRDREHREHAKDFRTKPQAQAWLDEQIASLVRGDYVHPHAGRQTLGDMAETWFATKAGLKPSTRADYRGVLDAHVLPRWGRTELRAVTTSEIGVWVANIGVTRSPATARKALGVLRQILDLAVDDRQIALTPAASIRPPKLIHAEQRFLAPDELEALAAAMPDERDRVLTLVLGWVGLRFGEAAGLNRSDVDALRRRVRIERSVTEVRGRIEIGTPKTHSRREVAMPSFLVDELAAYMAATLATPTAPLFPAAGGGRLRVTNWKVQRFDPAAESVGLVPPSLRVHDLRHTAASLTIRSGASVKAVQRQLGHKSATLTLDRYGHLFPDELDALAAALEGIKSADKLRTLAGTGSATSSERTL